MEKEIFSFVSANGKNTVHGQLWIPDAEPCAILQIAHGMTEFVDRYDEFARFMNTQGIIVVGNDHIGHGSSVSDSSEWGYFAPKAGSECAVKDMEHVTIMMKEKYPKLPCFLLGHSMGSFMTRRYIMNHGRNINGVIIVGTGNQPVMEIVAGKALIKIIRAFKGDMYRSSLVNKMMFGTYNRRIVPLRTKFDWLTRDEEIVDRYVNDPACTFTFTLNGFYTLLDTLQYIERPENIAKIPAGLPTLILSGSEDPVGNYGKAVKTVYDNIKNAGVKEIELKIYEGCRHEILNEIIREEVYADILDWIRKGIILCSKNAPSCP